MAVLRPAAFGLILGSPSIGVEVAPRNGVVLEHKISTRVVKSVGRGLGKFRAQADDISIESLGGN